VNTIAKKDNSPGPFVLVNMAMTADGKIATANRAVASFGSPRDLEHLYELRASADAVMCGARTIEGSGTILGTGGAKFRRQRLKNGLAESNLRVIVSGSGSIDSEAAIFTKGVSPIIILTSERIPEKNLKLLQSLADQVKICGKTAVDLPAAMRWLRKEWAVKRLLCEGGGELNDAMFRADLVDEINLTICPKIFGGQMAPTIADGKGATRLTLTKPFQIRSINRKKDELFTVLLRA
jgi:2,5-diamino-6-(ribosylamino)-4(3H)-pyrimidinone 5'-phosphate reductase